MSTQKSYIWEDFMKVSATRTSVSLVALGLALAVSAPSYAQTAAPAAAAEEDTGLDTIVVTASGRDKTQINSAVSVTNVKAELIQSFQPSSEAEIFRLLPGIQVAGTSGPGGNSNIAVRGLPVATGGSPFVQIQEDGLPTVLFGDIQFGNNDYWTHFDASVASVESIRGGTAATFASQAPGAVINYISQTGKTEGGYAKLSKGVNYDETRVDMRYGGHLNDSTYFHVGGYFKVGRGPLHASYNVSNSFQVKANLTKEFDEGKGFVRFLVKVADTQEPNYTGSPALATISGNSVGNIRPFPGFDGRSQSNYSIFNQDMLILNRNNTLERVKLDGITTKAKSLGAQFHYDFSDAITVDDNLRWTSMSGGFASPFLNVGKSADIIGGRLWKYEFKNDTTGNTLLIGQSPTTVKEIRYANGPKSGQLYTGTYVDNNVNVRTNIRDIGSFVNDFALSGKFDVGGGKLTARGGLFYMNQKIAMDWHVNKSLREVSGSNPAQLDLIDSAGNKITTEGVSGYNNNWGTCCARDYDLSYTDTAPYLSLDLDMDRFVIDGSVRFDSIKANGSGTAGASSPIPGSVIAIPAFAGGTFEGKTYDPTPAVYGILSGGVVIPYINSTGAKEVFSYTRNYTSWTAGALFKVNPNTSVFVRASRGGRFNGDRQTFSGKFNGDGSLNANGLPASVDFVKQYELGVKNRGSLAGGRYSVELTLLKGDFKQSTYELTATKCPGGAGGCIIDASYKTSGAELYATYFNHGFSLVANATYTKAKKKGSAIGAVFSRADGIPDLTYTVAAGYDIGEIATVGLNMSGVTNEIDGNGLRYPGGALFGANLAVRPIHNLELGVQVYNLFDKFDFRGNGGVSDGGVNPAVIGGAPALGRSISASVKYKF
jgi:outer membrane receptor protein involved in Fe transport